MEIEKVEIDGVTVLRFSGAMDLEQYPLVKETIADLTNREVRHVVVNLSGVDIISSSGIGALVHLSRELEKKDGRLILSGPSPMVANVLELLRLTDYFKISETESDACRKIVAGDS